MVIMTIRIILADDHRIIRDGLKALLRAEADFEVIAEAEDGRTAVRLATELSPDVVVMDISMPDLNGIEATRQITADGKGTKVVALSALSDGKIVSSIIDAGASGYIPKDAAFEELATAIRSVISERVYISPQVTGALVDRMRTQSLHADKSIFNLLSPREREVLQLLAEGKATKETARELRVSVKTVETHRRNMMEKLNIHSVAELTKYAIREGITALEA